MPSTSGSKPDSQFEFCCSEVDLASHLQVWLSQNPEPAVLLLSGPVGAGKTTLVREFCQLLGSFEVTSPTYSLHHLYENKQKQVRIHHFDLYRMQSEEELESFHFWESLAEPKSWIFIEWPETLATEHFSRPWIRIQIQPTATNQRNYVILS